MNKKLSTGGFMNVTGLLDLIQFFLTSNISCSHGVAKRLYGTGRVYLVASL